MGIKAQNIKYILMACRMLNENSDIDFREEIYELRKILKPGVENLYKVSIEQTFD
jgi:hypothetical protein